jgi:hypothetical protein
MATNTTFTQRSAVTLANGATSKAVTFTAAFINAPFDIQTQIFKSAAGSTNIYATVDATSITTTGFTVYFNAAIPDASYSLAYDATAVQPDPTISNDCGCGCSGGCSGGCGCSSSSNVANVCPAPIVESYLFTGSQGVAGPLAIFRGAYSSAQVYYDNTARNDIVSYAGFYWVVNNTAKNNTASWGTPTVGSGDWLTIGVASAGLLGGYNSYETVANIGGNSVLAPAASNDTQDITLGGAAGSRVFAIPVAGRSAGDRCDLKFTFPATQGIVITVNNDTVGGTQLLPASIYTANAYTTDGVTLSATWSFVFTGTAWTYVRGNSPS